MYSAIFFYQRPTLDWALVASHSCAFGNSIQHCAKTLFYKWSINYVSAFTPSPLGDS